MPVLNSLAYAERFYNQRSISPIATKKPPCTCKAVCIERKRSITTYATRYYGS